MKLLFAVLVLIGLTASAADDTNFFPTLTIKEQTYTNAHVSRVTPATAMILYDGGGQTFQLGDLPADLQQKYSYDPDKARQFLASEAAKKQEAIARNAAAAAAEAKAEAGVAVEAITIVRIVGGFPVRCLAQTSAGEQEILINGLPNAIVDSFNRYDAAKQQLDAITAQADGSQKRASKSVAAASGGANRRTSVNNKRLQAEANAVQNAALSRERVAEAKKEFDPIDKEHTRLSHINAQATGMSFGGTRIWRYVSIAAQAVPVSQAAQPK